MKKKKITRRIGDVVEIAHLLYKVEEDAGEGCSSCAFWSPSKGDCALSLDEWDIAGECGHTLRTDNKDIVFKYIGEGRSA
ncbi:MAG: hypothetical protein J5957_01035 [Prevotella sp.]|nr:hypothetical protein [Prevotella sp.]